MMSFEKAKKILGRTVHDDGNLFRDTPTCTIGCPDKSSEILMTGCFELEFLEAVIVYVKSKQ